MKVDVTQEDIDYGIPECGSYCPIALAVKRAVPTATSIEVDQGGARVEWKSGEEGTPEERLVVAFYPLPDAASRFVVDFDSGLEVMPFSFEMES